jgi:hypothetical protein
MHGPDHDYPVQSFTTNRVVHSYERVQSRAAPLPSLHSHVLVRRRALPTGSQTDVMQTRGSSARRGLAEGEAAQGEARWRWERSREGQEFVV